MSELQEIMELGVEGSLTILFLVIAVKIYKSKCSSESKCFKPQDNGVEITTRNGSFEDGCEEPA